MYVKSAAAANPDTYFLSVPIIKHELDTYFSLRKDMVSLGLGKGFMCPTNLPTGLHTILLALLQCDVVNLFGFSYNTKMLYSRDDASSPRVSGSHAWSFDTMLLRVLFLAGKLNICTV
mmetsp:Transcript_27995/g.44883  ORF Transcript_27995/g.44883 Transcript_27995/m.44883 type:complete len:118 (-) Transcript_27995:7-360(-)